MRIMSNTQTGTDFKKIIAEYKIKRNVSPDSHIAYVKSLSGKFSDAIIAAAIAVDNKGEKHIHQYRMNNARLKKFAKLLCEKEQELFEAKTFDEIYQVVSTIRIFGLGAAVYYDTSLRIAHTKTNALPDKIYLLTGSLKGAKNLGVDTRGRATILKEDLPPALANCDLNCAELNDLLCCYFAEGRWSDCLEFE